MHAEYDYAMKDIARFAHVGYTTLKEIFKEFKEQNIVAMTRVVGKAKMYKLNNKNPVVEKFIEYYWAVVAAVVRRENASKEKGRSNAPMAVPVSAKGFF